MVLGLGVLDLGWLNGKTWVLCGVVLLWVALVVGLEVFAGSSCLGALPCN